MTWVELWSIGRFDLKLSDREFWAMTPREFRALADRKRAAEIERDQRFGQLLALVAGVAGAKKSGGQPYTPADFFARLAPAHLPAGTPDAVTTPTQAVSGRIDVPVVPDGKTEIELGFDRWVAMCQARSRARGL